ncbi:MAG: DUF1501 domain-containing protein [Planctomycetes bacterium]|nr:DUF1501 domain-containing protein [Planctomycetota bacterium]
MHQDCPCTRRSFLAQSATGLFSVALASLLERDAEASETRWSPPDGRPHFTPKAKSVIWLFMNGGMSHLESFDPKPMLNRYAGRSITDTPYAYVMNPELLNRNNRVVVVNDANGQQRSLCYPLQVGFRKHGQSGIEVSDWFPHVAGCIDDIAVVRSLWTSDNNHGAQTQFHSGRHMLDGNYPTVGAWINYGLASLNDNLPQYISMGVRPYWNERDGHYLGPAHDAIPLRVDPARPVDFIRPETDTRADEQAIGFDLVGRLNRESANRFPDDPALRARIRSYELAFRMQRSLPEVLDVSGESQETRRLYGLDNATTAPFGQQLLVSRRLVERGVRFIQIQHGGGGAGAWDAHGGLRANHSRNCAMVDKPTAGLLIDLKRRGLLDDTIVVFGTEFGRTPGAQGGDGRDHHIYGFSVWLAGGGIKGGVVHGTTDELGFHAVEHRHYVTDIHATLMHQLGLDSHRLVIPGRQRLAIDHGSPIREIIS